VEIEVRSVERRGKRKAKGRTLLPWMRDEARSGLDEITESSSDESFFISAAESALAGIAALVPVGSAPAPSHKTPEPQRSCRACGTYLHGRIHYPLREFPLNHWCPMAYNLA
jgi:hypothetical protein